LTTAFPLRNLGLRLRAVRPDARWRKPGEYGTYPVFSANLVQSTFRIEVFFEGASRDCAHYSLRNVRADDGVRPHSILLCWNKIELAGGLFVEDGAFFLVSAAPVFVAAWDSQEVARADALLARVVFV